MVEVVVMMVMVVADGGPSARVPAWGSRYGGPSMRVPVWGSRYRGPGRGPPRQHDLIQSQGALQGRADSSGSEVEAVNVKRR